METAKGVEATSDWKPVSSNALYDRREQLGIFGGKLSDEADPLVDPGPVADDAAEPASEATAASTPLEQRRALRRLQAAPPSMFEQVVDLLYEWREHEPGAQVTDLMRKLLSQNHNLSDANAVQAMRGLITKAREERIVEAVKRVGLDEAERLLGLKKSDG